MGMEKKGVRRVMGIILMVVITKISWGESRMVGGIIECSTVTAQVSACSTFITYGAPYPIPGSPCCDAVVGLNAIASDSVDNRRSLCGCLMGLIATYTANATAISTLPGFCGISLGFNLDPNTDCNLYVTLSLSPSSSSFGFEIFC